MAGIYGTSALWPGSHHGHCPSLPGGMGSDPQVQFWDAAAVGKRDEHLKIASIPSPSSLLSYQVGLFLLESRI